LEIYSAAESARRSVMSVAKVTEIISSSSKSFDDAVAVGIQRANKKLKNVRSAWVKSQKAIVDKGKITEYRVTLKVTFVLVD
jgi:dodecin